MFFKHLLSYWKQDYPYPDQVAAGKVEQQWCLGCALVNLRLNF